MRSLKKTEEYRAETEQEAKIFIEKLKQKIAKMIFLCNRPQHYA